MSTERISALLEMARIDLGWAELMDDAAAIDRQRQLIRLYERQLNQV